MPTHLLKEDVLDTLGGDTQLFKYQVTNISLGNTYTVFKAEQPFTLKTVDVSNQAVQGLPNPITIDIYRLENGTSLDNKVKVHSVTKTDVYNGTNTITVDFRIPADGKHYMIQDASANRKSAYKNATPPTPQVPNVVSSLQSYGDSGVKDEYPILNWNIQIEGYIASQLAQTSQQVTDIATINIRDFGAIPTSENPTFDNTEAINNAITSMSEGQSLLFPSIGSKWKINGTIIIDKAIQIIGNNATLEYYGTGTAIKFGKDNTHLPSSDRNGVYLEGDSLTIVNKSTDVMNTIGVEYCNIIQSVLNNVTVKGFGTNFLMVGRNSCGCSQNTFNNLRLFDGVVNLKFKCELGGWVTENTWNKGQNTASSAEKISLDISTTDNFKPNSNQFNFINFENSKSTTVINIDYANNNVFNHCRFEGFLSGAIKLGANSENNAFIGGIGNSGKNHASFSDNGRNFYLPNFGQTNFVGSSGNGGIVTGRNIAETSAQGFPVFYTTNKTNPNAYAFKMGHNAMVGFRPDRQDYPFFYLDSETGKMYLTSGWFPKEEQPYLESPSKAHIQIKNDNYTDIGFKIGDNTKPAYLILGDYYIWVDGSGKLRIHTQKPTDLDTNGTIVGAQA